MQKDLLQLPEFWRDRFSGYSDVNSILQLSDYFISSLRQTTPWAHPKMGDAYLNYFFPLNLMRLQKIYLEIKTLGFFENLQTLIDFGCGPGTAAWILKDEFKKFIFVDSSREGLDLVQKRFAVQLEQQFPNFQFSKSLNQIPDAQKSLSVFSYSLNEIEKIPEIYFQSEALLIVEPSTKKDFGKLTNLRTELLLRGFHLWGPCPHAQQCPLAESRDWCHERFFWKQPAWLEKLETRLPMKNKSLSFSFLAARKTPRSPMKNPGRLIGDTQYEKGKVRQMICVNSQRQFLTWMTKEIAAQEIDRGTVIEVDPDWERKSNEIRVGKNKHP